MLVPHPAFLRERGYLWCVWALGDNQEVDQAHRTDPVDESGVAGGSMEGLAAAVAAAERVKSFSARAVEGRAVLLPRGEWRAVILASRRSFMFDALVLIASPRITTSRHGKAMRRGGLVVQRR